MQPTKLGRPPEPPILNDGRLCLVCKQPLLRRQMKSQLEPLSYWKERRYCSHACRGVAAQGRTRPCKKCGGTERKLGKCVPCREAYRNTPARKIAQSANWRKFRYGVTDADFTAALTAQGNACAICSVGLIKSSDFKTKRNFVAHQDHDHATRRLRGILCHDCNTGLARFKENTDLFKKAIEYLTKWTTI